MADVWNVAGSYDKPLYNLGETMTVALSGGDVLVIKKGKSGKVTSTPQTVAITQISDTSGRTWVVSPDGLSARAVA